MCGGYRRTCSRAASTGSTGFHITMRITVLQQQTKSLQGGANPAPEAAGFSKRIDSVKHLLLKPFASEQCAKIPRAVNYAQDVYAV